MGHDGARGAAWPPDAAGFSLGEGPTAFPLTPQTSARCWWRWVLGAAFAPLLLGYAVFWWSSRSSPRDLPTARGSSLDTLPRDPRLDYTGPFQNISPSVPYVGDGACAECHRDKAEAYRRHPMGRSLIPITELAPRQFYDSLHHNPFEALGRRFRVERQADRVWHRQERLDATGQLMYQLHLEVHYVIGSGAQGYSYLTDRDGYLFQTPISWYSQKQRWDLSPGLAEPFLMGRPITSNCLFCHANRTQDCEDYENRYEEPIFDGHAIGCQRCHGPGERHVRNPGQRDPRTGADYTIVNPRHLKAALREAVCEQCHLTGEVRILRRGRRLYDFRPGLPLEQFWSIFIRVQGPDGDQKAVNHVEHMHGSRCFQRSPENKKMGCISCHDPHVAVGPEQRVAHYRAKCLDCHQEQGCRLTREARVRKSPQDSCMDCHMPRHPASDVAHAASTNHRIVRRAAASNQDLPADPAHQALALPLKPFYQDRLNLRDPELARDLGIALSKLTFEGQAELLSYQQLSALVLLEQALRKNPEDQEALECKGGMLMLQNRQAEALAAFEAVLARSPRRERSLAQAARLAQMLKQWPTARLYWQRAVAANPWMIDYRRNLARLLAHQQAWEEFRPQCEAWMRLNPGDEEARGLWIKYLVSSGRLEEARSELTKLEAFRPAFLTELKTWFAEQARGR